MTSVFLSYAREDQDLAYDLRNALTADGIDCWLDETRLRPGDSLGDEIEAAIREREGFLVLIGPATTGSEWVRREIKIALATRDQRPEYRIVPLLLPGQKPAVLDCWFSDRPVA